MTSPTLVVIPSASPAASMDSAPGSSTSPAQTGGDAFSSHLQAQQHAVQNDARSPAPSTAAKVQKTDTSPSEAPIPALPGEPGLSLIDEDISAGASDDVAESGLPALALSIMTEVQALRQGAGRAESHSPLAARSNQADQDATLPSQTLVKRLTDQALNTPTPAADARSAASASASFPEARPDTAAFSMDSLAAASQVAPARSARPSAATLSLSVSAQRAGAKVEPVTQAVAPDVIQSLRPAAATPVTQHEQPAIQHMPILAQTQPSASAASLPGSTPAIQGSIATPVQSPEWGAALGRQFIALAQQSTGQLQSADIRLDPPELGPLRITLHVQDGVAHALITSPHAQVRQTIEQSLQQLQQQLADNGLSLGQADVGDQNASHQQFQEQLASRNPSNQGTAFSLDGITGPDASSPPTSAQTRVLNPDALVDTFA